MRANARAYSSWPNASRSARSGSSVMVWPSHRLQARAASRRTAARRAVEAPPICGHHVVPLVDRDGRQEAFPEVGVEPRRAVLVVPLDLLATTGEDASQHQLRDPVGVGLRRRRGQGSSPTSRRRPATGRHPPTARRRSMSCHEVPRRVRLERRVAASSGRSRAGRTAAPGIGWVEQPPLVGAQAATRSAVQEHGWLGARACRTSSQ